MRAPAVSLHDHRAQRGKPSKAQHIPVAACSSTCECLVLGDGGEHQQLPKRELTFLLPPKTFPAEAHSIHPSDTSVQDTAAFWVVSLLHPSSLTFQLRHPGTDLVMTSASRLWWGMDIWEIPSKMPNPPAARMYTPRHMAAQWTRERSSISRH